MTYETSSGVADQSSAVGRVPPYASVSVYGFLGSTLLMYVLGIGFFVIGGVFAALSDMAALLTATFLVPVVMAVHQLYRPVDGRSSASFALGIGAAAFLGFGSFGLVLGNTLQPGLLQPALPLGGFLGIQFLGILLLGLWLIGTGAVGLRSGIVGRRTSWAGIVAGVGYVAGMIGIMASLPFMHPLVLGGSLLALAGVIAWAVLLGGDLRSMAH